MDYEKELKTYQDQLSDAEKKELAMLAGLQKDIAVGDSAEDFIRHPFFRKFEMHMNQMIADMNSEIVTAIQKPGASIGDVQAITAGIEKIKALKLWLNKHVIAGRYARHAVSKYEEDTETMNAKIQEAVDKAK